MYPPVPGPACPLQRREQPLDVIAHVGSTLTVARAPLVLEPDYDQVVVTTNGARVPVDDPLWPDTEPGWRLRRAYLRHGERALVELPNLAAHWCGVVELEREL